ncbi:MAG: hypothetical protein HOV80_13955 [Polyangiaceae bacterium]|nr:hypothetical protein [Polyangiaceae bacterium]
MTPYVEGENFAIEINRRVAIARVYRRPELGPAALEDAARALLAHAQTLVVEPIADGMVIDLRRAPGAVSEAVATAYATIARSWEASAQPIAFLIDKESMQALQIMRVVSEHAHRFGLVTSDRDEAHAFAGNGSVPSHSTRRLLWNGFGSVGS